MTQALVITTIAPPTPAILRCREVLDGWRIIVVGDRKTPASWAVEGVDFLPYGKQKDRLAALIPPDSYSRKNLGYLEAIASGAGVILETDDDNFPYDSFGQRLARSVVGVEVPVNGWINAYRAFTSQPVWPRGLPLTFVAPSLRSSIPLGRTLAADCPIQQFLADGDPDVDAIYRLTNGREVKFDGVPLVLPPGTFSPLNSQNTAWWPEAYRFLYLPSFVSWRAADIWRGLVATAVSEAKHWFVAVQPPTVRQDRNAHDLMQDFREEVDVYLATETLLERLRDAVASASDDEVALRQAWEVFVETGQAPQSELTLVDAWNAAVSAAT